MKKMQRFIKYINNLSTRNKLISSYILVVFIPVLTVGLFLTYSLREMALTNAINEASHNVEVVAKQMQNVLETPVNVSLKLYGSTTLKNIIAHEYDTDWDIIRTYFDYNEFNELKLLYNEIEDIRIYVINTTMIDNWRFMKATEDIQILPWFQKAIQRNGKITWIFSDVPESIAEKPSLSMVRLIKLNKGRKLGVLFVKVKPEAIYNTLTQVPFETMLINDQGTIIESNNRSTTGKNSFLKLTEGGNDYDTNSGFFW